MKKRGCRRFVLIAVAAFLILLGCGTLWLFWPHKPKVPAEVLFPSNVYWAVRLKDAQKAYERHWELRGEKDLDDAMKRLFDILGDWPGWVDAYGDERHALENLRGYRHAILNLL